MSKSRGNPYVIPMNKRNKKQIFHHKNEPRGGAKNEEREIKIEYLEELDNLDEDG